MIKTEETLPESAPEIVQIRGVWSAPKIVVLYSNVTQGKVLATWYTETSYYGPPLGPS